MAMKPVSLTGYSTVAASLSTVLRVRQPLPFTFFTKWVLHDFHTSRWLRYRSDTQARRTVAGRKFTETPTLEMVSVNRYGGNEKRQTLVTAFRTYRSVCQSNDVLLSGQKSAHPIRLDDFEFRDDEMKEVVTDFACLYLNASILFASPSSEEIMVGLLSRLGRALSGSFHWECVPSALIAQLQLASQSAGVFAAAFAKMLHEALGSSVPKSFSREGLGLLSLSVARAIALLREDGMANENVAYLLSLQQKALEALCGRTAAAPLTHDEFFVLTDAICWRFAGDGKCFLAHEPWHSNVVKQLRLSTKTVLDILMVSQCAQFFCALCLILSSHSTKGSSLPEGEEQWKLTLDPLVSQLDCLVRTHSVADAVCVLVWLFVNTNARARYRKYPLPLLEHLREEQSSGKIFSKMLECGHDSTSTALLSTLDEIRSSGEDDLADAADALLSVLSQEVARVVEAAT